MLRIQASYLSTFLERASLGSKLEGIEKAKLTFGPEGVRFLSVDQKSKAVISDCFLPKVLFLNYEKADEFLVRNIGVLIGELNLIDPAKTVDIYINKGIMKLVSEGFTASVVSTELDDIGYKTEELLTPDRKVFVKEVPVSKMVLDKVSKATNMMNSIEVRFLCDGKTLRFVIPSRSIFQEEISFAQEVDKSPPFTISFSSKFLKPVIAALSGRSTTITVADGFILFKDKDVFTNNLSGVNAETIFQIILATLMEEGQEPIQEEIE